VKLQRHIDGFPSGLRLANNFNVAFCLHQHSQAFTDDYVIIGQENGNHFHIMGV
jgi:hypothetical protein